jgi:methionyl-tRNA formyltransferase
MTQRLRVVFMGTPAFATPTLQQLAANDDYDIVAVITQPDAAAGRGRDLTMSPVKRLALDHGLRVFQPPRIRRPDAVAVLRDLQPDVQIVAAFGQILPRAILDIPAHGTLNVHASLLPRWRGASPIAAAILAGDDRTGVTIMRLDEGMDTGDVLTQRSVDILPDETAGALTTRLANLGAQLLIETLPFWVSGRIEPQPQDSARATICRPISKESGRIDWSAPAAVAARALRAYAPWPGAYTYWNGKLLKIIAAQALPHEGPRHPGVVLSLPEGIAVTTAHGLLLLKTIQLEGKRALAVADFARGQRDFIGATLA